jgi:hypothetical protein
MVRARRFLTVFLALCGCSEPPREENEGFGGSATDSPNEPTASSASTTPASSESAGGTASATDDPVGGSSGEDIKLDVGPADDPDAMPDPTSGCTAVDVLFVVDNSASMTSYQDALVSAFPSFVTAMDQQLPPQTDLHVGVTTSSFCGPDSHNSHSENNCVAAETSAQMLSAYLTPEMETVAGNGYQGRLVEHQGERFFSATTGDAASMAALGSWFAGAAAVGSSGCSFEYNAAGAAHVFHPANADANDGFLRDAGAVLLIVFLSDEADQSLEVDGLDNLVDLTLDAKAECGGADCIITAGIFSEFCTPDQNAAFAFASSFGEDPTWGEIGSFFGPPPDYSAVIGEALGQVVAQTCDEITPEG